MNELQKNMFIGHDRHTKLLIHGNGSNGSTAIIDSATNKSINVAGSTQISTAQAILTNSSILLNGTTDYLSLSDSDDWDFGSGDFTIDFRVYFNSLATTTGLFAQRTAFNNNLAIYSFVHATDNKIYFYYSVDGITQIGRQYNSVMQTSKWYHLAFVKSGGVMYVHVDGAREASNLNMTTNSIFNSTAPLSIGAMYASSAFSSFASAYIKEFRIDKGIARYTTNFTPQTHEYYI